MTDITERGDDSLADHLDRGVTADDSSSVDPHQPEELDRRESWTGLVFLIGAIVALGVFASWSWAFIVVAIIFMIFMHEMGHFLTAKLTGMKVTEFFIGFGPRIWSFTRGETEYGVKAIPAGAYVRIVGMNNLDEVEPGDEDRAYRVKSFPRKILVVSAGSGMHFLMAVVLIFSYLLWQGTPADDGSWVVGSVSDQSAAGQLDLEVGDEIVSIDGIEFVDFEQFGELIAARGGQEVEVVYRSDGDLVTESVVLGARLTAVGAESITGLEVRDRILQIDGVDVFSWDDVNAAVDGRFGEELRIVFDPARGSGLQVVDNAVVSSLPVASVATTGFFGISPDAARESLGVVGSATKAVTDFGGFFTTITTGMWDLLTGAAVPNFVSDTLTGQIDTVHDNITSTDAGEREIASRALDTGNPDEQRIISIYGAARFGSELTEQGFANVLLFLAGLNVSIGVLNLIPLPPLDGGHVVIATYERIRSFGGRRHEVDYNKVLPLTYAVFLLLTAFGLLAIFRDIIDPISLG
jgi:RIP metalloprotease RseP